MSFSGKMLQLAILVVAVSLPAEPARRPYPSPEEQIHSRLSAGREQAGSAVLERRDGLDALALARAQAIAARPAKKRLGGSVPVGEVLKEGGGRYRRAVERLILLRNIDRVAGVMEKWQADPEAWKTATAAELDAAGYGTARAKDGWIVFVVIMVQDLVVRDSAGQMAAMEQAVLEKINEIRKQHDCSELKPVGELAEVARAHSRNMLEYNFFSHADPSGTRPAGRVRAAGMTFQAVAENLTMNNNPDTPADQAVSDWMDSPGHRRNILDDRFRNTGVGLAVSDDGHYYFTQLFLVP